VVLRLEGLIPFVVAASLGGHDSENCSRHRRVARHRPRDRLELARAGARVAINYAGNAEAAAEALALVKAAGGDGFIVQGDVAVAADRERLVAETVAKFGRIDLHVNNAGVAPKVRADLLDAGEESFDRLFAINLKGPFFLSQLVAKQMLTQAPTRRVSAGAS
jgi:3-oxoacyl-[acyl-carrier protein] reductase